MKKSYKLGFDIDSVETGLENAIDGVIAYQEEVNSSDEIYLFGNEIEINDFLMKNNKEILNLTVINTTEKIETTDEPVVSIRRKKESAIVKASKMLKDQELDAFISSGSTGALVAAGIFIVGRIKGIERPALGGMIPKQGAKEHIFLMDLGASSDVKVKNMVQFAQMSNVYLNAFFNIENPKIGLLNIGSEDSKGNQLYKETFVELREIKGINFIGNIEARDIFTTEADIIVMDGFTGNAVLKTIEATVGLFSSSLKEIFKTSVKTMFSALLIKTELKKFVKDYDYKELGGTPIFGINGLILKAHGSSDARAFKNAFRAARENLEVELIKKTNEMIEKEE